MPTGQFNVSDIDGGKGQFSAADIDIAPANTGAAQQPQGALSRFWQNVNPAPSLMRLGNALVEGAKGNYWPGGEIVRDAVDSHVQTLQRAVDAAKAGKYTEAAGHTILAAVPLMGPAMDNADQDIHNGNIAGALGTTASVAAPGLIKGAPVVARAVRDGVGDVTRVDPAIAITKALKPSPSDPNFTTRLPDTLANIKAQAPSGIAGNADLLDATKKALGAHMSAFEGWMQRARQINTQVATDPIVDATKGALSEVTKMEDPGGAKSIVDSAQNAYAGKSVSVDKLRELLKDKNAELKSFYDQAPGSQNASVAAGKPIAIVKAQRDAIADSLYKALDPENEGAGPREIQQRYGDLKDFYDAALKRKNAIIAQKPVSKLDAAGKMVTALADLPGKAVTGNLEGALSAVHDAGGGSSDALIARAFKGVGSASPLPYPQSLKTPTGLLSAPPIVTSPPADSSFVRSYTQPPNPPNPSRALPPPSRIQTGGFSVADDLVPVKHPVTGQIEYIPKWMLQKP